MKWNCLVQEAIRRLRNKGIQRGIRKQNLCANNYVYNKPFSWTTSKEKYLPSVSTALNFITLGSEPPPPVGHTVVKSMNSEIHILRT